MYHISELAKKQNINSETIRYYEKMSLIEPKRLENNYRVRLFKNRANFGNKRVGIYS